MARVRTFPFIVVSAVSVAVGLGAGLVALPTMDGDTSAASAAEPAPDGPTAETLSRMPLLFVPDQGQAGGAVDYYVQGEETSLGFDPDGVSLVLSEGDERHALGLSFPGARSVTPEPGAKADTTFSWFKGSREDWITSVPTFRGLSYDELWPGIDLSYSGGEGAVKYRFTVAPGADPSEISINYRGADSLTVAADGSLVASTPLRDLTDPAPVAWSVAADGTRIPVDAAWTVEATTASFRLGTYDQSLPLVIDPEVLVWAGYIGGDNTGGSDSANQVAVAPDGDAFIVGTTAAAATSFPDGDGFGALDGADTSYAGGEDAYVARVQADGSGLAWVSYVGGTGNDNGTSVAVGPDGDVYVAGLTNDNGTFPDGDGFGGVSGFDTSSNGWYDAFVARLEGDGSALNWAGFIGGDDTDWAYGVEVGSDGDAFVVGFTQSDETTFPDGDGVGSLTGPDTTYNGGSYDGFVARVEADGSALAWAGFIGGSGSEFAYGLDVSPEGDVYAAGATDSTEDTFPDGDGFDGLTGPDTTINGAADAFVVKVDGDGSGLAWAGYIGGAGGDGAFDVVAGTDGDAYVSGSAAATGGQFPDGDGFGALTGPDVSHNGSDDGFVARVEADGSAFVWAGFVGGSGNDSARRLSLDADGGVLLAGYTASTGTTFPDGDGFGTLTGPDTTHNGPNGGNDAFVAEVKADGSGLDWAGYIGGSGNDFGTGIATLPDGDAYVSGGTGSTEATFPDGDGFGTLDGPDTTYNGGNTDGFVVRLTDQVLCPGYEEVPGNHIVGTEGADVLEGTGGVDIICGLGGDDVLWGYGGADVLDGGEGNDSLRGRAGADTLYGGIGNDELLGGAKADDLYGEADDDKLVGNEGADELYGAGGVDNLLGRDQVEGNDVLDGGAGTSDSCRADPGDSIAGCP